MKLFEVNEQTCNKDGFCAAVCPAGLIVCADGEYPAPVASWARRACIRCGHCVAICPTDSLSHCDIPVDQCPPVQDSLHVSAERCEHFLRSRRSIRVFTDEPVSRDELTRLIELARYAPSGHNSQCAEWLVIGGRNEVRKLADIVAEWMHWQIDNRTDLAVAMHLDVVVRTFEAGKDIILRDAPVLVVAHGRADNGMAPSTCTIALTYLELAALGLGLGTCWAGYFHAAADFPAMAEALALPDGHQCFGAMMVGYPKFSYKRLPTRKEPPITWRLSQ